MQKPAQWAGGALTAVLGMLLLAQHSQATTNTTTCGVSNCNTCVASSLECTACTGISFFLSSGTCLQCPSNCEECSSNSACGGTATCSRCRSGYYLDTVNNQCISCPQTNCATCSSASNCLTCDPNWYPAGTCNVACPSNCATCSSTGTCTMCNNGYYKLANGNCQLCPTRCATCDSTGTCTQCSTGSYEEINGDCTACPGGCKTCSKVSGKDLVLCDTCLDTTTFFSQWAMSQGASPQCKMCPANCMECTDTGDCGTCKPAYWKSGTGRTGVCTACPGSPNCASCTNNLGCDTCNAGYTGNTCTAITCAGVTNCATCLSANTCAVCDTNYFLTNTFTCSACFRPDADKCAGCHRSNIGYLWNTANICQRCPDNCLTCSAGTCTKCMYGYKPNGNACDAIDCSLTPTNLNALSMTDCGMCMQTATYWDTTASTDVCTQCPVAATLVAQTFESCERCMNAVWEPTCQALTCNPSVTNAQCTACNDFTLIGGTTCTACNDMITNMTECAGCKTRFKDSCNYVDCTGTMEDAVRCTYCIGRKWVTGPPAACHSVNCNDRSMLMSQEDCEACPGNYWDTSATPVCQSCSDNCVTCTNATVCTKCEDSHELMTSGSAATCGSTSVDCYDLASLTEPQCLSCPGGKWTAGSPGACTMWTVAECTAVTTAAADCTACRVYSFYLDSTSNCARCNLLADAEQCTQCRNVRYNHKAGQCAAAAYGDQELAQIIPSRVWKYETIDASPVNCLQRMRVYEATDSKCVAVRQCDLANMFTQGICESCGFDWTTACQACSVTDCADCRTAAAVCDACKEGFELVGGPSCVNVTANCADDDTKCNACANMWWDGATCQTQTDATTPTNCLGSTNEDQCHECVQFGFYWSGSACAACDSSVNPHSSAAMCEQCKFTRWSVMTHTCKVTTPDDMQKGWVGAETTCSGAIGDTKECNYCTGRKWNSGTCEAVDCSSPPAAQADCEACPNMWWNTSGATNVCQWCPENCDTCSSATACTQCEEGFILQTDDTCQRTAINDVCTNTPAVSGKEAENCNNCPGYWYNSGGSSCDFLTDTVCATDALNNEAKCWSCRIYGYVWDTTGSGAASCSKSCVDGMPLDSELRCTKCRRVKWEASACKVARFTHPRDAIWHKGFGMPVKFTMTLNPYPMDAPSCQSAELYWQSTCELYKDVKPTMSATATPVCNTSISQMSKAQCDYCQGVTWNSNVCEVLATCSASSTMAVCDKCENWFWDTTSDHPDTPVCRAIASSTCGNDVDYQSEERCNKCKKMESYLWEQSVGMCKMCSSSVVRRSSCKSAACANEWYDDSASPNPTCKTGPADCKKISADGSTCEWCEDNKTWDPTVGASGSCVDCVLDTLSECESCRHRVQPSIPSFISYFVTNKTDCYDCPSIVTMDSCHRCSHATAPNMYWDGASCVACGAGCTDCTMDGCDMCDTMAGFYAGTRVGTHTPCMACGSNCRECTSSSACTKCDPTYCLNNGVCVGLSSVSSSVLQPGCKTCFTDSANALKCETCHSDYYLRRCDECDVVDCIQCPTSSATCTQCRTGHRLDSNGECPSCSSTNTGCMSCLDQTMASSLFTCTACPTNLYALETPAAGGRRCEGCTVPNCMTCSTSKSVCTRCISSHYLTSAGVCAVCSTAITNCASCQDQAASTDPIVCLACSPGHGMLNGQCLSCHATVNNCGVCQGAQTCSMCDAGYVQVNGECVPGCHSCSGWDCKYPDKVATWGLEACPGLAASPPTAKCAVHTYRYAYKKAELSMWTIRKCETDLLKCMDCVDIYTGTGQDHGKMVTACAECCTNRTCNAMGAASSATPAVLPLLCAGLIHLLIKHIQHAAQ